jgi:hypothetical protein
LKPEKTKPQSQEINPDPVLLSDSAKALIVRLKILKKMSQGIRLLISDLKSDLYYDNFCNNITQIIN